jgi:hypothetical protein
MSDGEARRRFAEYNRREGIVVRGLQVSVLKQIDA